MAGKYPGIVKTKLQGVNQLAYLTGASDTSARNFFLYYTGATPSAVRYKNWKIYFTMEGLERCLRSCGPPDLRLGPGAEHQARSCSSRRWAKTRSPYCPSAARLASPSTAYLYNWNMLPIGQQLWLRELESFIEFPALQDPASYNLTQVLEQVKKMGNKGASQ